MRICVNLPHTIQSITDSSNNKEFIDSADQNQFEVSISQSISLPDEMNSSMHATWIRMARCASNSNSNVNLPVHSIEIPFDHVIGMLTF